ncbi:MAG: translation elongation factor Ts [Candidatus Eisenbacteria bacterium]|nr:translation elongation factor Ts [Candidatus Eisenbacteria bacterium]
MEISAEMVKQLRERTGAGMMQCKKALSESSGNMEQAIDILRRMGIAQAAKRAERIAAEGVIEAYVHAGSKIGVLVELNSETDFVARTDDFRKLAHDVALQVAATAPRWVSVEDVPAESVEAEKAEIAKRLSAEGVPASEMQERAAKELERFYAEQVLLRQPNIRDGSRTIGEMVTDLAGKLGENIRVRRFSYFRLGESD